MTSSTSASDQNDQPAGDGAGAPRRLSTWKKLFFTAIVVFVPLVAAELLCRVTGVGHVPDIGAEVSDWHNSPDGRRFWVVRGPGFNQDGMRDRDHAIAKPEGTFRVIFLGDSVTYGHGVSSQESYPSMFESFLGQMKVPVEVFNIAVSGWSTLQEVRAYEVIARKYKPDHVFLGVCLNDVAEMHNNLLDPPPYAVSWLLRHSALVRWLVDAKGREVHQVRELFSAAPPPAVEDGWNRVLSGIERLAELTRADGCAFSVLIFPFRFQVEPGAPPPVAQERLFRWCLERHIPVLDLLPALRRIGPDAFVDESHFTPLGARTVAEELVRWGRTGCAMCGYDLAGVQQDRCPRCGHVVGRNAPAARDDDR